MLKELISGLMPSLLNNADPLAILDERDWSALERKFKLVGPVIQVVRSINSPKSFDLLLRLRAEKRATDYWLCTAKMEPTDTQVNPIITQHHGLIIALIVAAKGTLNDARPGYDLPLAELSPLKQTIDDSTIKALDKLITNGPWRPMLRRLVHDRLHTFWPDFLTDGLT